MRRATPTTDVMVSSARNRRSSAVPALPLAPTTATLTASPRGPVRRSLGGARVEHAGVRVRVALGVRVLGALLTRVEHVRVGVRVGLGAVGDLGRVLRVLAHAPKVPLTR